MNNLHVDVFTNQLNSYLDWTFNRFDELTLCIWFIIRRHRLNQSDWRNTMPTTPKTILRRFRSKIKHAYRYNRIISHFQVRITTITLLVISTNHNADIRNYQWRHDDKSDDLGEESFAYFHKCFNKTASLTVWLTENTSVKASNKSGFKFVFES